MSVSLGFCTLPTSMFAFGCVFCILWLWSTSSDCAFFAVFFLRFVPQVASLVLCGSASKCPIFSFWGLRGAGGGGGGGEVSIFQCAAADLSPCFKKGGAGGEGGEGEDNVLVVNLQRPKPETQPVQAQNLKTSPQDPTAVQAQNPAPLKANSPKPQAQTLQAQSPVKHLPQNPEAVQAQNPAPP